MKKKELNPEHGNRLKMCLDYRKISQKELAEKSGYTRQYISNIVVGKKNMSLESAKIFAKILNVQEEFLLCENYAMTKEVDERLCINYYKLKNEVILKLLIFSSVSPRKTIIETEEGTTFDAPYQILIPEESLVGRKVNISGNVQTIKSIKIEVDISETEEDDNAKIIPYNMLYSHVKNILDYAESECERFKKEIEVLDSSEEQAILAIKALYEDFMNLEIPKNNE